jgi:hypothetical protein
VVEVEESGKVGNPADEERSDEGSRGREWWVECAGLKSKRSADFGTACCPGGWAERRKGAERTRKRTSKVMLGVR